MMASSRVMVLLRYSRPRLMVRMARISSASSCDLLTKPRAPAFIAMATVAGLLWAEVTRILERGKRTRKARIRLRPSMSLLPSE